jgi:hypothetical protein
MRTQALVLHISGLLLHRETFDEVPEALLDDVPDTAAPPTQFFCAYVRLRRAQWRGEPEIGREIFRRCLGAWQALDPPGRKAVTSLWAMIYAEAAYEAALQGDLVMANALAKQPGWGKGRAVPSGLRIEAAVAIAAGEGARARALARQAMASADELLEAATRSLERRLLEDLLRRCSALSAGSRSLHDLPG